CDRRSCDRARRATSLRPSSSPREARSPRAATSAPSTRAIAGGLLPLAQTAGEILGKKRAIAEALERSLDVVLEPAEGDGLVVDDHIGRAPIAVPRLTDRSDVDQT